MISKFFARQKPGVQLTMRQLLFLSCLFSLLLVCIRVTATGTVEFVFLIWNLFLAFIPYLITELLSRYISILENKVWRLIIFSAWLVFIPNSFYIITDLFHLERFDTAPRWLDLLLLFSFAWNGLLFGILSVRRAELLLTLLYGRVVSVFFLFMVMWLNAFGIYVGRYLRYNSWDIIVQPFSLFGEMFQLLFHPFQNKMEWGMITVWAVFITLFYITIKKIGEDFLTHQYNKPTQLNINSK